MRALYEHSVVPVAGIARIAGVTERSVYKWAKKYGWLPRVVRLTRGTGGRFVALADASRPALDPLGAQRTAERCVAAGLIAAEPRRRRCARRKRHALAQAERAAEQAAKDADARERTLRSLNRSLDQAVRMREEANGDLRRVALADRVLSAIAAEMERV